MYALMYYENVTGTWRAVWRWITAEVFESADAAYAARRVLDPSGERSRVVEYHNIEWERLVR